ncbi:3',5'-cyclic-nucleotide phosphodiesterase [Pseudohaliea rubra DSM 19751]|uniref:3',5'-cyclic-nucleotide phosphodiesterase n=1 Tax=Pseudohaliea rubra DSM 19751 TaxID=1265313 RepID=A0A095WYL7_9GAMM|nr:3',5'-cyclic-nucleotide phosphodiesterase [Pseudohaliea rubra DSM 19751]
MQLVQVTDTHLAAAAGGTLLGMDTDRSLLSVLEALGRVHPAPDALLATGDLADAGAPGAYERLQSYLDAATPRHFWLPGNHDDRATMVAVAGEARLPRELRLGVWQVLMLDSQIPGQVGGRLGDEELARLEAGLEAAAGAGLFTLVCLHHQPVPVGCAWLDEQRVADADRLFAVLERFPGARGLLWGHVHQALERDRNGLKLLCTPSTCVQFKPGQSDFAVDDEAPGFRWLALSPDGGIDSGVTRVPVDLPVDLESRGYQ